MQTTLAIAFAILEAAALGFLGLGAQPPTPEWGAMLADSYKYFTSGAWWVFLLPGRGHHAVGAGIQPAGRRAARRARSASGTELSAAAIGRPNARSVAADRIEVVSYT